MPILDFSLEKEKIDHLARYVLIFGYAIDLGGQLGLRPYFVLPSLLYLILRSINNFEDKQARIIYLYFLFVLFPAIQSVNGFLSDGNVALIISQLLATIQLFLLYIALKDANPKVLLNEFLNALLVVQIFSIILYTGDILQVGFLKHILNYFANKFHGGYFGHLVVGGSTTPIAYFKSTLIFTFSSVYFFSKRKYLKSSIALLALLVGLTKAGFALSIVGVLIISIKNFKWRNLLIIAIFTAIIIFFGEKYYFYFMGIRDSYTLQVRVLQIHWFKNWIASSPISFLFGSGLGTYTIIPNYGKVYAMELDYLDLIRKYGIIWVLFILNIIFQIIKRNSKKDFGVAIAYLLTAVAVGTNPLIITSIFFILSYSIYKNAYER